MAKGPYGDYSRAVIFPKNKSQRELTWIIIAYSTRKRHVCPQLWFIDESRQIYVQIRGSKRKEAKDQTDESHTSDKAKDRNDDSHTNEIFRSDGFYIRMLPV